MKNPLSTVRKLIDLVNNRKSYPALRVIGEEPEMAALISKLVRTPLQHRLSPELGPAGQGMTQTRMQQIAQGVKERIGDAENMMQLFPDLELSAQILVSSILSPKDMVNYDLIFSDNDARFPAELSMKMLDVIKEELEAEYSFQEQLPHILRQMLFDTGSYIRAVIPESAVDDMINRGGLIGLEHLNDIYDTQQQPRSMGFLGPLKSKATAARRPALESFQFERIPYQTYDTQKTAHTEPQNSLMPDVSDNFLLLKMPQIAKANNAAKVKGVIEGLKYRQTYLAQEAQRVTSTKHTQSPNARKEDKPILNSRELEALVYKGHPTKAMPFVSVPTKYQTSRRSVGRPLVMRLPSESVIPVHVPGDVRDHIGYFVLIDEDGNPVTRLQFSEHNDQLNTQLSNPTHSMTSFLLEKARRNLNNDVRDNLTLDQAAKIYTQLVEDDLIERLRNGLYGTNVALAKTNEVYRVMLSRTFMNQYTRLVYIPAELVTYMAHDYHNNGIGKSLLDGLNMLISLRGILMFAQVMALTKSAIALTHVNMTLDPNDADPQKTIEMAVHDIIKMRQQYFPLGVNTPIDLVDWVQRAGFEFTFEGHPGLPQTKFDFETKNLQHTVPDTDFMEQLRKQTIMALSLSPEVVDSGFSAEFATTVVANNILLSKRVLQIQEKFTPQLTDYAQKLLQHDETLRGKLLALIKDHKGLLGSHLTDEDKAQFTEHEEAFTVELLGGFIENLKLELPRPDITTLENQSQAYQHYSESLDTALEAWINSEILNDTTSGDLGTHTDMLKATYKSYFLRKWMAENGYMSELTDIVMADKDGNAVIDLSSIMKEHIEGLTRSGVEYISSLRPMVDAANTDLNAMNVEEGAASPAPSDSGDSGGDDGGDSFGGDFDFGGDDGGGEEDAAGEEPTEGEEDTGF
ncbi:MAG: hypothetical protein ACR2HF_12315 [Methylococcaceae bacterium]